MCVDYTDLNKHCPKDPFAEEVQDFAETINRSARRLTRMVDDVLDLDRLEAGIIPLQVQSISLNEAIQGVVATMRHMTNHHRFELQLDPALPRICADPDLIGRLLSNLVANAIKFSPAGGPVGLRTAHRGDEVELTVEDEGIGVPADRLETIFARYDRVSRPEQIGIEGAGLGLPIARAIVRAHGGQIWAERREPAGTVLRVMLQLRCPQP
jgi:signal transduction histidine kinase